MQADQALKSIFDKFSEVSLKRLLRVSATEYFNGARNNQALDPDLKGFIELAKYSAIIDQNTSDFCNLHNGEVIKVTDPRFIQMTPPNHFGCRSLWIYYTKESGVEPDFGMKDIGNEKERKKYIEPQKNFGGAI